ncbi:EthD family reductase [Flavobacterium sp. ACAM 123]|uniref:EthD family reductase n=1 Tax=Flavobacterium sp. ACAM 123 TaxID=1189620 RepID=UPI000498283E|nr:EthD family reductase [Flavobacterium sp. ACAM 123]
MIKVSIMYPNGPETTFDVDYYKNSHLPMIAQSLGDALISIEFNVGIGGREPGELAPYVAIGHLTFDSVESFQSSFAPHAAKFAADIPNYTNVVGELQISAII